MQNTLNDLNAPQPQARDYLVFLYLDWVNNYLTVAKFAEHNGLTVKHTEKLIQLMEYVFNSPHPEA